jgi:thiol-disulfide isomerase/thioredoxin
MKQRGGKYDDIMYKSNNNNIILQLFEAPWCGHCKDFAPKWEALKDFKTKSSDGNRVIKAKDLIDFQSYDDNHPKTKEEEISGYPTLMLNVNGTKHKYEGARTPENILRFILDKLEKQ